MVFHKNQSREKASPITAKSEICAQVTNPRQMHTHTHSVILRHADSSQERLGKITNVSTMSNECKFLIYYSSSCKRIRE